MPVAPTPLDIANTVARNLVPLGGILFLGWSAPTVLVLYFADTMFAIAVMFAGLAHSSCRRRKTTAGRRA